MTEQTLSIETFAPRTPLQEFWFYFKQNKGAVIGLTFILAVALISIFAPWIAPFDPIEQNRSALLLPPAWYDGGNSAYLLGTDDIGRDILSRIIYGTRISVFAGFIIVILSCILGTSLGLLAGYYGGALDTLIVRFIDIMLAIPNLLFNHCGGVNFRAFFNKCDVGDCRGSIPSYVRLTRAAVFKREKQRLCHLFTSGGSKRITFNVYCHFTELPSTSHCTNDDGDF